MINSGKDKNQFVRIHLSNTNKNCHKHQNKFIQTFKITSINSISFELLPLSVNLKCLYKKPILTNTMFSVAPGVFEFSQIRFDILFINISQANNA